LGACGVTNNDAQPICAISHEQFDNFPGYDGVNPNHNPVCNRQIQVNYNGNSVILTVTDRCGACQFGDIDMTETAFKNLADPSIGRLFGISWTFLD
jgi:hypothetical protein